MVLSEVSVGHIGRNGRAMETPPDSDISEPGKRMGRFPTPGNGSRAALLPTPSSVQSMLRSGTELGDVGELALNPRRNPSPSQRMPSTRSSSSVPPASRKYSHRNVAGANLHPSEHDLFHSFARFNGPGSKTGSPNAAFIYRNRSQASSGIESRTPSRGPNSEDGRSYALMHSSFTSRSVPRHPMHINGYLRSQGDPRRMRPPSPLAYPTRLKRPGYRPSSPALTEIYRSGSRSPFGLDRGTSFRTASPLPVYRAGRPPSRLPQGANPFDQIPGGHQVAWNGSNDNSQYLEAFPHRHYDHQGLYAYVPAHLQPEGFYNPGRQTQGQHQTTPSPPPLFYDYSEQFQQNIDPRQADNTSTKGSPTRVMHEDIGNLADDNDDLQTHNPSRDSVTVGQAVDPNKSVADLKDADGTVSTLHRLVGSVQYSSDLPIADAARFSFESERDYAKRLSNQNGLDISPSRIAQASIIESARARQRKTQHSNIHAPVPRRSLSSPSNRDRFSSILSIDEGGLPELNEVAAVSHSTARVSLSETPDHSRHSVHNSLEVQSQDAATGVHTNGFDVAASEVQITQTYRLQSQFALPTSTSTSDATNSDPHIPMAARAPNSGPRTMKRLPPLPRSSVVSVAPPHNQNAASLPFSFTALRSEERKEEESVAELGNIAASYLDQLDRLGTGTPTVPSNLKPGSRQSLPPSRTSSRPWNSEGNYTWNDEVPQLEIANPKAGTDTKTLNPTKTPRFTLHRGNRSSSSAAKITKPRPSVESRVRKERFSASSDVFQSTPFGKKSRPNLPGAAEQSNPSRASPTPLNTRFVESFDLPVHDFGSHVAPSITLVPPSPGLNLEARSFFSDDSSQMRLKGSLRKRLSHFKATVTRASTSDDARGVDRALLGSAMGRTRNNGRNSRHSGRSQEGARVAQRWRLIEKVRAWYLRVVARKNHDQSANVKL